MLVQVDTFNSMDDDGVAYNDKESILKGYECIDESKVTIIPNGVYVLLLNETFMRKTLKFYKCLYRDKVCWICETFLILKC